MIKLIDQLQQENEKLIKSNDSRLKVIKELRRKVDELCEDLVEMREQERLEMEYEESLGEDY